MFGMGYAGTGIMMVLGLLLVVAIIWGVVHYTSAQMRATSPGTASGPTALELLRQRYARGEIDAPTFTRMRQQLTSSAPDVS
jgi:putative membrane protein